MNIHLLGRASRWGRKVEVEGLSITKRNKETIQFGETEDGWCVRQVSS